LILETYDESNRYHFVALKIFESNDQLSFDCQKCIKTDIISFIKEKYKLNENYLFIPDRDLKVISYEIPYNRMELKYEWEE